MTLGLDAAVPEILAGAGVSAPTDGR
jgi:hypothetical protein